MSLSAEVKISRGERRRRVQYQPGATPQVLGCIYWFLGAESLLHALIVMERAYSSQSYIWLAVPEALPQAGIGLRLRRGTSVSTRRRCLQGSGHDAAFEHRAIRSEAARRRHAAALQGASRQKKQAIRNEGHSLC